MGTPRSAQLTTEAESIKNNSVFILGPFLNENPDILVSARLSPPYQVNDPKTMMLGIVLLENKARSIECEFEVTIQNQCPVKLRSMERSVLDSDCSSKCQKFSRAAWWKILFIGNAGISPSLEGERHVPSLS